MELLSIGKFSKMVGVTPTTLRNMHQSGELVPAHVSQGGTRYYSSDQLNYFLKKKTAENKVIAYCRAFDKKELKEQIDNVKTYMFAKGYQFEIIEEVGSATDCGRDGLKELISKICHHEVSKIVVLHKDRLVRFGYELIECICDNNGVELEVIDNTQYDDDWELTNDLIQIISDFANQLYGPHSKRAQKLISEVKNNTYGEG